jgi:CelD/BcsL family acetyltransferase involved in cellulose biosynthesis
VPDRSLPDEFGLLAGEWDALAGRTGASPFVHPGWVAAWWQAFGQGELQVLTGRDGDRLTAVLPVARRHGLVASPCNWHSPEFEIACETAADCAPMLDAIFSRRPQMVSLRLLDGESEALEQLHAAATRAAYHVASRTVAQCPFVAVDGDWDSYERRLSRNLRGDLARCRRRLEELGTVSVEVSHSIIDLEAAFELERLGWKGARGTAMASRPRTRRFYEEIARWAEARGWLRLLFLRAGTRRVAFHLAIEHRGIYVPLKGGFDPAVGACSPGKLIIHATLERAFGAGLRRYEFLAGGEEYKLRWATGTTERLHLCAFAPTVRGAAARLADARGRPLARRAVTRARALRKR